jgi:hypothetical protein
MDVCFAKPNKHACLDLPLQNNGLFNERGFDDLTLISQILELRKAMKQSQVGPQSSSLAQKAEKEANASKINNTKRLREYLNTNQTTSRQISSILLDPGQKSPLQDKSNILSNISKASLNNDSVLSLKKYSAVPVLKNPVRKARTPIDSRSSGKKKAIGGSNYSPANIENQSFCIAKGQVYQNIPGQGIMPLKNSQSPLNVSQKQAMETNTSAVDQKTTQRRDYSLTDREQCTPTSALIQSKLPTSRQKCVNGAKKRTNACSLKIREKSEMSRSSLGSLKGKLEQFEGEIRCLATEIRIDHDFKYKILNELVIEGSNSQSWKQDEFFKEVHSKLVKNKEMEEQSERGESLENSKFFSFYPEKSEKGEKTEEKKTRKKEEKKRMESDLRAMVMYLKEITSNFPNLHVPSQIRCMLMKSLRN